METKKVTWEWEGVLNEIGEDGKLKVYLKPYRSGKLTYDTTMYFDPSEIPEGSETLLFPGIGVYVKKSEDNPEKNVLEFKVNVMLGKSKYIITDN